MSNPKDTSDWLETQVKKIVREELANGCRCNNADGTRRNVKDQSLESSALSDATFSILSSSELASSLDKVISCLAKFTDRCNCVDPIGVDRVSHVSGSVQSDGLNRHALAAFPGKRNPEFFGIAASNSLKRLFDSGGDFQDGGRVGVQREPVNGDAAGSQNVSPVRSEPSAGHTCSSALTVQEGGDGTAVAPGVGDASSPAFSTPRFVAVGEYVYDREMNLVTGGWPGAVAAAYALDLNADPTVAGYMNWEDAK